VEPPVWEHPEHEVGAPMRQLLDSAPSAAESLSEKWKRLGNFCAGDRAYRDHGSAWVTAGDERPPPTAARPDNEPLMRRSAPSPG